MAAGRDVVIRLRGDIGDFQAKMVAAGRSVSAATDKMTGAEKQSAKFRQGLTSVGDAAGKMGLVAAAGLGAIVAVTAKFDKQMSAVQAATHESADGMERLRSAAIKAGADTAFSASEAANGIEQLAKAGVSTKDILGGGLAGALDLAAAGSLEVGDAAETAATAMTQFGLSGADVPHIADLLAAAAGKAQGEVSDMAMALKQSGLVANQVGLSIEETAGALAAFASNGLLGSDAGTSFKTMLMRLLPTTKEAGDAMESIGFNAFDSAGNMKSLTEIAGGLHNGLKDLTAEQRQATLQTIFGSDAIRAATVLYEEGAKGIGDWIDKTNDTGFAAETAAIKLDNLAGDMEAFKGSMETALIGSGEGSQGALRGLVQSATDAVNAFNDLPGPIKSASTSLLALVAVTGGGLWFTAKAISGVASMRVAIEALGVSAKTTTGLMSGLAKGSVILAAAWSANELAHWGDANLTLSEYVDNLHKMADTGKATAAVSHLSFGIDNLGEALKSAALTDNPFGMKWGAVGQIEDMDAALSKMASGPAAKAFDVITKNGKEAGLTIGQIRDLFPQYTAAAEKAAAAADRNAVAQRTAGRVLEESASGTHHAARAADDHAKAMQKEIDTVEDLIVALGELNNSNLDARSTFRAYQAAIDEARGSLKKNGRTLDENTEKGRANAQSLDDTARAAIAHAGAMQKNGRSMGAVNGFLQRARQSLFEQARAFGMSREDARKYVAQVLKIPKTAKTKVTADTGQAESAIGRVRIQIGGLKDRTITITTAHRDIRVGAPIGVSANPTLNADGGSVPKTGKPYADRHPYLLADGEEVISNRYGQADRHRSLLKAINAGRLADGGTAGGRIIQRRDTFDLSTGRVRSEFAELAKQMHGGLTPRLKDLEKAATGVSKRYNAQEKQMNALQSKAKDLRSSASGAFNNDPFGNGAAGLESVLTQDKNDANYMASALYDLRRKGISRGLGAALAGSGDVGTAQELARMSKSQINRFDAMFAQRINAQRLVGDAAVQTAYGAQMRALNRTINKLERRLNGIEGAVERGARRGIEGKAKTTAARRRTTR